MRSPSPPKSPAPPAVPDYVAAEVFLENSGFFTPSSKQIKHILSKTKVVATQLTPDGVAHPVTVEILANPKIGLPITTDLDYYRAFLKICDEIVDRDGRFQIPIAVPTATLIRYAGKTESAQEWRAVRRWLERMTFTGIRGGIFLAKQKDYTDGFLGTVFSQVVFKGNPLKNGTLADANYIWLAPWFLSNYYYRHLRRIDLSFHQHLRKPIAKALYPLLETGWYASQGGPYSKNYHVLCQEFLLTEHPHLSLIQQQLDPSHEELQQEQFLSHWEYRKATTGDTWIITYHPGQKFFSDQQARLERRTRAEQLTLDTAFPALPSDENFREQQLVDDILSVCGDPRNRPAYIKILGTYSILLIEMALSETRQAALERRIKKSKGAYFMDTLKRLSQLQVDAEKVPDREGIIGTPLVAPEPSTVKDRDAEHHSRDKEAKRQQHEAELLRRQQAEEQRNQMTTRDRQTLRQQAEARIPDATKQVVKPESAAYAKMIDALELAILIERHHNAESTP